MHTKRESVNETLISFKNYFSPFFAFSSDFSVFSASSESSSRFLFFSVVSAPDCSSLIWTSFLHCTISSLVLPLSRLTGYNLCPSSLWRWLHVITVLVHCSMSPKSLDCNTEAVFAVDIIEKNKSDQENSVSIWELVLNVCIGCVW